MDDQFPSGGAPDHSRAARRTALTPGPGDTDAVVSRTAAELSHDLRHPLAAIRKAAERPHQTSRPADVQRSSDTRPGPGGGSPPGEAGRPGRRVLVVDDNRDSAETMAELVRLWGHEVRTAHDGPKALEAARGFRPQVVLLDVGLPGMDGYELARRLRAEGLAGELLVSVTGYGQEEDRRRAAEAGFDHHLTKPVDPNTLLRLVGRS